MQVIAFMAAVLGKTGTKEDVYKQRPQFIRQMSTLDENETLDCEPREKKVFLVVGPASVLYNWVDELETWGHFSVGCVTTLCLLEGCAYNLQFLTIREVAETTSNAAFCEWSFWVNTGSVYVNSTVVSRFFLPRDVVELSQGNFDSLEETGFSQTKSCDCSPQTISQTIQGSDAERAGARQTGRRRDDVRDVSRQRRDAQPFPLDGDHR